MLFRFSILARITCAKMLINAGIERIVIRKSYPDKLAQNIIKESGVTVDFVRNTI